jgi:ergothioneine biosynthesis protein EgtB
MELVSPLETEDFVIQPVVDVSPPKWHLAHTTWFFENFLLNPHAPDYRLFHDDYCYLFNSYYQNVGERWQRVNRGLLSRPTVNEIRSYREYVDKHMEQFMQNAELDDQQKYVLELGIQHEQQHQELMMYDIKHILGLNPLFPVYRKKMESEKPISGSVPDWDYVEEGIYEIGFEDEGFCFDNEISKHKVFLHSYKIMGRLVTIREYMEFMESGGYKDFNLWLMEGWEWVQENGVEAPFHWHKMDGQWMTFTLSGLEHIDPDEPVTDISFYEADAFVKWSGKRLPTEFEWETACKQFGMNKESSGNFSESNNFNPRPANSRQYFGDTWEWTNSAYLPYPGYKIVDGALGEYNGKFMINQMVLRGGSCVTPRDHIRPTYRNFFHPHLKWLFSGMRLAESI